ncbi:aldose 1-epimerase [Streptomyces sp. SID6673]|nr:aldose 1-epimerase [Streptomyces sp. SID11726]NEB23191.1 aldose 1-epimerase [Streptomyces sp. SID6673]
MEADGDLVLRTSGAQARVCPQGGRLTSLRIADVELLQQGEPYGCFPMVPWCGRMRDGVLDFGGVRHRFDRNDPPHALHGIARDHRWETETSGTDHATLSRSLDPQWPFEGTVTQDFTLTPGALTMRLGVSSADTPFPAQAGWHPWFRRHPVSGESAPLAVDFAPAWQEERGPDYLPTGTRLTPQPPPWDDCFGMPSGVDVTLDWPDLLRLRIRSDAEWVVIFDHRPFAICVEPQSGPPDGLNTTPRLVAPGHDLVVTTRWTW